VTTRSFTPNAAQLLMMGATEIISKPFSKKDLIELVHAAAERLQKSGRYKAQGGFGGRLPSSPFTLPPLAQLDAIAKSDSTVLITGGTAAGNEMLARLIHNQSPRASKPWTMVDCAAALPETLLEDKLYGHVKGAFTGAINDTPGAWEGAEGGTIFLRNITAIPTPLQPRLLHALQTREFRRIGSTYAQKVNVRVIADSPRPLLQEDLFYRLSVLTIDLPHHEPNEPDFKIIEAQAEVERLIIESALESAGGNRSGAARLLGMPTGMLYKRLKGLRDVMLRPTTRDE
jgi:DNA-binding NtrC family response regulator